VSVTISDGSFPSHCPTCTTVVTPPVIGPQPVTGIFLSGIRLIRKENLMEDLTLAFQIDSIAVEQNVKEIIQKLTAMKADGVPIDHFLERLKPLIEHLKETIQQHEKSLNTISLMLDAEVSEIRKALQQDQGIQNGVALIEASITEKKQWIQELEQLFEEKD
jgi:hypothetical protein